MREQVAVLAAVVMATIPVAVAHIDCQAAVAKMAAADPPAVMIAQAVAARLAEVFAAPAGSLLLAVMPAA